MLRPPMDGPRPIGRRGVLAAGAALASLPQRLSAEDDTRLLDRLLRASSIYAIKEDSTQRASPSACRVSASRLARALASKRAIFLGEHHPDVRDHLLQAALLRLLAAERPLAVGLEAVQRRFQPILDEYAAGRLSEAQLFEGTEWRKRWYWSFEAYAPIVSHAVSIARPLACLALPAPLLCARCG